MTSKPLDPAAMYFAVSPDASVKFQANGEAIEAQALERANLRGTPFVIFSDKACTVEERTVAPTVTDADIEAYSEASVDRNIHTICTNALRGNVYPRAQVVALILKQRAKDEADVDAVEDAKG